MPYADREAQRAYQREWCRRRRLEFLDGRWCVHCGETDTEKLEIDHIDPKTKVSHRIWSWSEDRRKAELKKCQVLCHACHETKTSISYDNHRFISKEDVRKIRKLLAQGVKGKDIAERFGIRPNAVSRIKAGKTYAGV